MKLNPKDKYRLNKLLHGKVNFLAGTMPPAAKYNGDLESLEWVLKYYHEQGVFDLILQTKWMGSRCQVYLVENPEDCYVVTKRGFMRRFSELEYQYSQLWQRLTDHWLIKNSYTSAKPRMFILDAELLPWGFLAEGLINKDFLGISEMMRAETVVLQDSGFLDQAARLEERYAGYNKNEVNKKAIVDELGHHVWQNLTGYWKLDEELIPLPTQLENLDRYDAQVRRYANYNTIPTLVPFFVLKVVYADGSEIQGYNLYDNEVGYLAAYDYYQLGYQYLDTRADFEYSLTKAKQFFDRQTTAWQEGIVVKPRKILPDVIPYFKVRNSEYLRMVYGPNYDHPKQFNRLWERKQIKTKMRKCLAAWKLGWEMLKIPYAELKNSPEFKDLVLNHILLDYRYTNLDPRL